MTGQAIVQAPKGNVDLLDQDERQLRAYQEGAADDLNRIVRYNSNLEVLVPTPVELNFGGS